MFVCGLKNAAMQKRLLAEVDLTLNRAVELAQAMEMAEQNAQAMQSASFGQPHVQAIGKERQSHIREKGRAPCMRCGDQHEASKCPFIDSECYKCQKKGHIARACRSSQPKKNEWQQNGKNHGRHTNMVVDSLDGQNSGYDVNDVIGAVRDRTSGKPITVQISINGRPIVMELDTGSAVTILNEKTWRQLGKPRLEDSSAYLTSYSGHRLSILGDLKGEVEANGQHEVLYATVLKTRESNLLGRDWLRALKLDWSRIFAINSVGAESTDAKPDAQPKFVKPRPIPYGVKGPVGDDLDQLERNAVRKRIAYSNWAAPIGPVMKPQGAVRTCGDVKVTKDPQIKVDQYPLPGSKESFAWRKGSQQFTKLDSSEAMNESQKGGKGWKKNLATFLPTNCITVRAMTGMTPGDGKTMEHAQKDQPTKEFKEGDLVWARNYRDGDKWVPAKVVGRRGTLTYKVRINDSLVWKRHVDQLKPRSEEDYSPLTSDGADKRELGNNAERAEAPETAEVQQPREPQRRYPIRERKPPKRYEFEDRREEL
jgi:predicted aspartyl protease